MKTNKKKGFYGIMSLAATIILAVGMSACAFSGNDGTTGGGADISETLAFENLTRLAFMGGSLIYNPDIGVNGQIAKGAVIAVRLSKVEINETAEKPDEQYKETSASYGYIMVNDVDTSGISLSYTEYYSTGVPGTAWTTNIALNGSGDINKDGLMDLTFAPPALKRSGMENAVFLTFIGSQENGNVGMYSVIPEQYSRQAYPNGIMGVNPNGQFIVTAYQPSGERSAIRGAEYGDIVVDTVQNKYGVIKNGEHFRSAAYRIGDSPDDVADVVTGSGWSGEDTPEVEEGGNGTDAGVVYPDDLNPNEVTVTGTPDYFDPNQFTPYATPQNLFDALPASLKTDSPSTEGAYITTLNRILEILPATLIDAVLAAKTFDDEFTNGANELKNTEAAAGSVHAIAINRAFLANAYPAFCQPAAAKTVQEMFPILSVNFSSGDPDETMEEQLAEIRQANLEFRSIINGKNARAAAAGYNNYTTKKNTIQNNFKRNFTIFGGAITLNKDLREELENYFDDSELSVTIGLYGSLKSYWGKIELGVGAALLLNAEVGGLKASHTFKGPSWEQKTAQPIIVGPVVLNVGVSVETALKVEVKDGLMNDYFAGFIGLYGGRVWVGADYGIKWKWKIIPVGGYFNPYAKGEKVSETAYYFGPKSTNPTATGNIGTIIVTPSVSFGPTLTLWGSIYGKIGGEAALPNTLNFTNYGKSATYNLDLVLGLSASAGIKFDFKIFTYKREFGNWPIVKSAPIPIVKNAKAWYVYYEAPIRALRLYVFFRDDSDLFTAIGTKGFCSGIAFCF